MNPPLEDGFQDILAKTQAGLGLADADLAREADIEPARIAAWRGGIFRPGTDDAPLARAAAALGLRPEPLLAIARGSYRPDAALPDGLARVENPFHGGVVNAYLAWDPASPPPHPAAAFDAGTDAAPILAAIRARRLRVEQVFLTHTHADHVGGLRLLLAETGATAHSPAAEPFPHTRPIEPGATFRVGALEVTALSTPGHSPGGTTYLVAGLARPAAIVGDALFAGSMGRGITSFETALANNRQKIAALPEQTILCPGHGPPTSVALERAHNPFL